jgi:hypothetical protein
MKREEVAVKAVLTALKNKGMEVREDDEEMVDNGGSIDAGCLADWMSSHY